MVSCRSGRSGEAVEAKARRDFKEWGVDKGSGRLYQVAWVLWAVRRRAMGSCDGCDAGGAETEDCSVASVDGLAERSNCFSQAGRQLWRELRLCQAYKARTRCRMLSTDVCEVNEWITSCRLLSTPQRKATAH